VKQIDPFCPTLSWYPVSCSFPLYWLLPTPIQPVSWIAVLAKLIREDLVRHSHLTTPSFLDPGCHCLTAYPIQHLPCNRLHCHLEYPSRHSSLPKFQCLKCFQAGYPHHLQLGDGWFFWFSRHLLFEFLLQGGAVQTKLLPDMIFPTIKMQPHHHGERVTDILQWSLPYLKCILQLSLAWFDHDIPSVQHIGFASPATSPKRRGPWPFCAMFFPLPLSSFRSCFLCSGHPMMGHRLPISRYWVEQTALQRPFRKCTGLWFWLSPADNILPKGNTVLHSDTMWYHREDAPCHIGDIGVLGVRFLSPSPPVGDIQYPKWTANFDWVGVVIIDISEM